MEERELIYSKCRAAICERARTSEKAIDVAKGFLDDRTHTHEHFKSLSGVDDLRSRIEENWDPEMKNMEKFVRSQDNKKRKFASRIAEIDAKIETDYEGSRILRDVHILMMAGDALDKDGRGLFLLPEQKDPVCNEPFLRVTETVDR